MTFIIGGKSNCLALETAKSKTIDNEQISEISAFEHSQFRIFDTDYGSHVIRRNAPTGIYNCHGMTFASRRTGVFETSVIQQILEEDSYVEVSRENVLAGDAILYFSPEGDIEHSGIVVESPKVENLFVPLVCSKWGKYAELIHRGNNCPYNFANVRYYRVKYD